MMIVVLVIHVMLAVSMIAVVLVQKSEGGALGIGGGGMSGFMTGRSTASLLTRTTAMLAAAFMATSILLAVLHARAHIADRSILDALPVEAPAPAAPAGSAPATPDGAAPPVPANAAPVNPAPASADTPAPTPVPAASEPAPAPSPVSAAAPAAATPPPAATPPAVSTQQAQPSAAPDKAAKPTGGAAKPTKPPAK